VFRALDCPANVCGSKVLAKKLNFGKNDKLDFANLNNIFRAYIVGNSSMISSKSAFFVSSLSILIKAGLNNLC